MTSKYVASFIKFLEDKGLLTFNVIGEDEESFVNRLKIQKYVFLAKYYGLNFGYGHSMYRYGPYSPSLAADYYKLAESSKMYNTESKESLPKLFDSNNFMSLVKEKDTSWLEIATTLLDQKNRFENENELVKHVERIKCDYPISYIKGVLKDLKSKNLMS
ncbi:MAG: hypothetical protein ACREAD_04515 [Nitrosopumilaceae archaeon]